MYIIDVRQTWPTLQQVEEEGLSACPAVPHAPPRSAPLLPDLPATPPHTACHATATLTLTAAHSLLATRTHRPPSKVIRSLCSPPLFTMRPISSEAITSYCSSSKCNEFDF